MKIVFKKQQNKAPTLHLTRVDGSETWMTFKHSFIQHDLVHYAAETVLDWQEGFYGLIEKGANLTDFDADNRTKRPELPLAAIQMEFIVNLLETEIYQKTPLEDFNQQLLKNCEDANCLAPLPISDEKLKAIRATFSEINQQWRETAIGGELILEWSASKA